MARGFRRFLLAALTIVSAFAEPMVHSAEAIAQNGAQPGTVDPALRDRMLTFNEAYFTARSQGELPTAHAFFGNDLATQMPLEAYLDHWGEITRREGPVTAITVTDVTWYAAPDGSSDPLAAVDYAGSLASGISLKGYVVWRPSENGFELIREEMTLGP